MISIANLLENEKIGGHYFAADTYVRGDLELGLLENRRGDRLLAIPDTLIEAIYAGLEQETGSAARLVLFNCGKWWGKNFYVRFCEEIQDYYDKAIAHMEMVEFLQCFRELWKTSGWGLFDLETTYYDRGFLVVKITNSPFASKAPENWKRPVCFLEAGILASFFSQLTGRELFCVQTTCESLGADCNRFAIGLGDRVKPAEALVAQELSHEEIMAKLCE
ncbi:4-vinyl reductase [Oxynema sp. CENA135]|uniref:V4R domain-containing protein n=1 Tax=Oxynema sp. CENA135 TaxID=984206 RepID=UPI00190A2C7B|nr:V4R domain-containing protein [Oxynema sp. CENA135]MBK4732531.1 4-vinyl reductase [Oxynema sp. CENA135]